MKKFAVVFMVVLAAGPLWAASNDHRPNLLVIMADDWSWPHAGFAGDPIVKTPALDRLASDGVVFTNAFAASPVGSESRLAVLTGRYPWLLPKADKQNDTDRPSVPTVAQLLRRSGYVTAYAGKGLGLPATSTGRLMGTKFSSFESFLGKRDKSKPFFFWFGATEMHRPYVHQSGGKQEIRPDSISVPPWLPDAGAVRADLADYYHTIQRFDQAVGKILDLLEKEKLRDRTIIFLTSDNGMPFPRAKANLYDAGTHVPLVVFGKGKFPPRRTITDFVSLADLAPTWLELAALKPTAEMNGKTLLPLLSCAKEGRIDPTRDHVVIGMEKYVSTSSCRALRTAHFLYIRNFEIENINDKTDRSEDGPLAANDSSLENIRKSFLNNTDASPSKRYLVEHQGDEDVRPLFQLAFGPRSPIELYDLRQDPSQLKNVVLSPKFKGVRADLGTRLVAELIALRDPRVQTKGYTTRTVQGWTVLIDQRLLRESKDATRMALELMDRQLADIGRIVPQHIVHRLRRVPIWLSPRYPNTGHKAEYHPGIEWLRRQQRNPLLAKGVELTNVAIFDKETRRMPLFLLHELAHAYHDQVLGFDEPRIRDAWVRAAESHKYDRVERRNGKKGKAYAMTNPMEYFAESTEAFFGANDFFPFDHDQLKEFDPHMYQLLRQIYAPLAKHGR
ncbi:MAG: hypothetical protein KatS3mg105_4520 [Gemmatales bacterium]|nr:MAG: hypothetical protein KatS3mg105_4520 [Gemmatales bacterium]